MTQTSKATTTPCPNRTITCHCCHMSITHGATYNRLAIKRIFHFTRKDLIRTILCVSLSQLIAITLTKGPETTSFSDYSGC